MSFALIEKCASDLAKLETLLMDGMEVSTNFIGDLARIVSSDNMSDINEQTGAIQDVVKDYININEEAKVYIEAVKAMNMEMNNNDSPQSGRNYGTIFQEKLHEIKRNRQKFTPETHDKYKELLLNIQALEKSENGGSQLLTSSGADGDDDLLMCQENVNTVDPITKKEMTDPVRCKLCTHVYEKSSILDLINQKRGSIRCPIAGCTSFVRVDYLEPHIQLKRFIEKNAKKY